ncbi:CMRF35-like molecule 9 [Fukomys damarensis]|uniref:CMRF35-like molecule 9 n=1 Tax=Fukomys damarensis TaxID=885580 RepID=UPI001455859D|nr:CMRF35-like molecule 9 [Fukomys damarensis]
MNLRLSRTQGTLLPSTDPDGRVPRLPCSRAEPPALTRPHPRVSASAALTCPEEESAFEGDTVTLRCTYEGALRTRPKYWCREVGVFISRCANKIFSGEDGQEVRQGRASILDRPGELALVVTLRGLTLQDSGKYWCGAQKLGPDDACLVALAVLPGSSRPAVLPDSSTAGDPGPVSSSHSSVPRCSHPSSVAFSCPGCISATTSKHHSLPSCSPNKEEAFRLLTGVQEAANGARLLAPILVILSLLLAAGLIALGAHVLQGRRPGSRKESRVSSDCWIGICILRKCVRVGPVVTSAFCSCNKFLLINGFRGPPGLRCGKLQPCPSGQSRASPGQLSLFLLPSGTQSPTSSLGRGHTAGQEAVLPGRATGSQLGPQGHCGQPCQTPQPPHQLLPGLHHGNLLPEPGQRGGGSPFAGPRSS